ncbi:MAG: phosphatase PAP2 family protein [Bacteroidetes bacterium]|nr:phosphatase PAP2 family protein [Bacteroidota bacterium]
MSFSELVGFYPEWNFALFEWINRTTANAFFDVLMPAVRNKYFWAPLYVFLTTYLLINHKLKGFYVLLLVGLSFALANSVSAEILKPIFKIDRPCNDPVFQHHIELRVHCGPGKSFPSTHATNHFAIAVCLGLLLWRRWKWPSKLLLFWAFLVSYAQVYVGVHYPLDVMMGAILGSLIGIACALGWRKAKFLVVEE